MTHQGWQGRKRTIAEKLRDAVKAAHAFGRVNDFNAIPWRSVTEKVVDVKRSLAARRGVLSRRARA